MRFTCLINGLTETCSRMFTFKYLNIIMTDWDFCKDIYYPAFVFFISYVGLLPSNSAVSKYN